jgi:NAD(P)H-dependent flavin oxidoreductase YrpB (nitropropane dioxygenase family)
MLKTVVSERLGIEHPIFSVGFGPVAGPELVAAVSNAGALGVLGGGDSLPLPYLLDQIRRVRALTTKPFGVNVILEHVEEGPIEACIDIDHLARIRPAPQPV